MDDTTINRALLQAPQQTTGSLSTGQPYTIRSTTYNPLSICILTYLCDLIIHPSSQQMLPYKRVSLPFLTQ
jgi:hypothetical protein